MSDVNAADATPNGSIGYTNRKMVVIDGYSVKNTTDAPDEWRADCPCPALARKAKALGWDELFIPSTTADAKVWLFGRLRATILPSHLPFTHPLSNHSRAHIFWRYAKHGLGVDGLDYRTCRGLRNGQARIFCIPYDTADASKLLAVSTRSLIVLAPEQIEELENSGEVEVGCGEGWVEDRSYAHPSPHHPHPCVLDALLRKAGA